MRKLDSSTSVNYQVRSYGSYKEDDDKKYHTLAEYKPKPRLTAKYTSLYADSLNNYTPPQTNAPASNADATNPDVVHFIQKQEEYIEQLERESQYCRDELNNLLGKVKEVISENEHLHEAQKNKIISRMFHTYEGSETDDVDDSTGLDSDNKVTPLKSRKARPRSAKLEGPNIVFESRIAELEAQLTQSKIDLKKVQDENNENKRKLAAGLVDSTCLDGFKRQIDNLQRDKSTLESQISKLKLNLDQRDGDLDNRHKRSSDIIEQQLREERNNLEAELRRLKEELASERNKIRELTGAGARRAMQERSAAELRHNAHTEQLARDLAAQYELAAKLELDLDRQRRDENDLKREITMKNAAIEELKIELKNKSATLQADLAQANAEKASLEEELASARLALERQQRQARHDTNRLNSEIHSLRQRLDRADADLVHSRRENLRLSEQISTLEKELNMKNLTPMPSENKKDKELSSMLESMENKHGRAQSRGRAESIRTQRDRRRRETSTPIRTKHPKESDSSNNPIIVGPLTTNQELSNHGERIYNLPLMIQQPFLREKKEPIKVDISVKLIPKPRKKDKKRRDSDESKHKGMKNSISMEVTDNNVKVVKETLEFDDDNQNPETDIKEISRDEDKLDVRVEEIENSTGKEENVEVDALNVDEIKTVDVKEDETNNVQNTEDEIEVEKIQLDEVAENEDAENNDVAETSIAKEESENT